MPVMGEIAVIFGLCLLSEGVVRLLPFAFPASVLSMLLLLALLLSGAVKQRHIDRVCTFLTGSMAFFFLPSCVSIMGYWDTLSAVLIPFLLIAVATVPLVYAVTGWTVQLVVRLSQGRRRS